MTHLRRAALVTASLALAVVAVACTESVLRPETIGGSYEYSSTNPGGVAIEGEVQLHSPDAIGAFIGTANIRIYFDGELQSEESAPVTAGFVSHGGPVRFRLAGLQHTGRIVERRIEGETEWRTEDGAEGRGTFVMQKR
jgi:hypothetical protein